MPEPIVSPEQIIAKGEELERASLAPVKPWEIYKALGETGKFGRYKEIWNTHCAQREQKASGNGNQVDLPDNVTALIETEAERWQARMKDILQETIAQVNADHAAQLALQQKAHLEKICALELEIRCLEDEVAFYEDALADAEEDDAPDAKLDQGL